MTSKSDHSISRESILCCLFSFGLTFTLLAFGGVHPLTLGGIKILLFVSALFAYFFLRPRFEQVLDQRSTQVIVVTMFLVVFLCLMRFTHPEKSILSLFSWGSEVSLFVITYVLARLITLSSPIGRFRLRQILLSLGAIAAGVALVHWFSDNGRLFWTFKPDYEFVSKRARWPFVNPNHLAHFLLPCFFLFLGEFCLRLLQLLGHFTKHSPDRAAEIARFLSLSSTQRIFSKLAMMFGGVVLCLMAILGSLSRGAWLSLAISALVFLAVVFYLLRDRPTDTSSTSPHRSTTQRKRKRKRNGRAHREPTSTPRSAHQLFRILLIPGIVITGLLFLAFLGEGAGDIVSYRLTYGLIAANSDIRFQLLEDTLPLISQNLLLGGGADNWERMHALVMHPGLSGLSPQYLHSDPIQLLTELGVVGLLCFIVLVFFTARISLRAFRRSEASLIEARRECAWRITANALGLLSLVLASFFDFPFRIPAISLLCAACLAMLLAESDAAERE